MYYPKFFLPAGGLPFGGTNFQIFRCSKKIKHITCICQSATTKVTVWAVRSFHVFGKKWFWFCNFNSKSILGGTPHVSNYCNIELILFVQTEDNTSYFLRIQHFLFSWNDPIPKWRRRRRRRRRRANNTSFLSPGQSPSRAGNKYPVRGNPSLWYIYIYMYIRTFLITITIKIERALNINESK